MKQDTKNDPKRRETKSGIRVYCEGLDHRPVTHAELVVLETYAGDLIRRFVADQMKQIEKE